MRKIVILNQAANYLTIRLCNAFAQMIEHTVLITGSIHEQGESLNENIRIDSINPYVEGPAWKKLFSYLLACWRMFWLIKFKYRSYEVFFVSLPPMAYLLNILLPNRFSMIIWDVYPDVFKITGMKETNLIFNVWSRLNKISFRKSFMLFTIGEKMAELLEKYIEREKIIIQPIWSVFQENKRISKIENPFIKKYGLDGKFVVQYSGNIGLTHHVEVIVKIAELLRNEMDILFQIIGRGSRVSHLKKLVKKKNLPNCIFLPFQSDEMFLYSLSAADLGVVILNDTISMGSVPSKSYNLMSLGIPSLYFAAVDSELNNYVLKYRHGECFTENEIYKAIEFILALKNDKELWQIYSNNSIQASENFRSCNADNIVNKYLES